MSSRKHAAAFVGIWLAVPALALAASPDTSFVNAAATSGLAEVQAGKVAEQKASNPAVKQFAGQMVTDHSEANAELKQLAGSKGLILPTQPDAAHVATLQRTSQLSGSQFDEQYMQGQVADHEQAVSLFQREANSGQDPQLKAYAAKYLPVLQRHLQMAQATIG